jgi:predicted amidophosphoribosyltransferase
MEKICKTCPNPTNSKKSLCETCFKNQPKKEMPCNMCQTPIPLSKKFLSCKSCFEKNKPVKEKKEMPCNMCQAPIPDSKKFLSCKSCFEKNKPVKVEKEVKEKKKKIFKTVTELLTENKLYKAEIKKLQFEKGVFERKFEIILSGDSLNRCSLCYLKIKPGQNV